MCTEQHPFIRIIFEDINFQGRKKKQRTRSLTLIDHIEIPLLLLARILSAILSVLHSLLSK